MHSRLLLHFKRLNNIWMPSDREWVVSCEYLLWILLMLSHFLLVDYPLSELVQWFRSFFHLIWSMSLRSIDGKSGKSYSFFSTSNSQPWSSSLFVVHLNLVNVWNLVIYLVSIIKLRIWNHFNLSINLYCDLLISPLIFSNIILYVVTFDPEDSRRFQKIPSSRAHLVGTWCLLSNRLMNFGLSAMATKLSVSFLLEITGTRSRPAGTI